MKLARSTPVLALPLLLVACAAARAHDEEQVVRRMVAAINARDFDALDDVVAADVVRHCAATPDLDVRSLADFKTFLRRDLEALPDATQEIRRLFAGDGFVALSAVYRGTQTGAMGPFPATGRSVEQPFLGILRIADGKIAEIWVEWDNLGILAQLGHYQPPGGEGAEQ